MIFDSLEAGPLATNCYLIGDEQSGEAAVIDPGGSVAEIRLTLARHKLTPRLIICTHAHFDHVGGNKELAEGFEPNLPILIHEAEKDWLLNLEQNSMMFGVRVPNSPEASRTVDEGDTIEVGRSIVLEVLHTAGHSPGSISLKLRGEPMVFVGDLLFMGSIGRTDFPGGDYDLLINNVREKIFPLGDEVKVFSGHGPATTVGRERQSNPFFGDRPSPFAL